MAFGFRAFLECGGKSRGVAFFAGTSVQDQDFHGVPLWWKMGLGCGEHFQNTPVRRILQVGKDSFCIFPPAKYN
jgi:hypothetical protein